MATEVVLGAANVRIKHDKRQNLRRFLDLIEEAASQQVDLLVLPEVGLQGYADFAFAPGSEARADQKQYYFREAEPIPGPSTEAIRAAAERHGMYVQLGMAESTLHGNAIFNSTALISPAGVVAVYRKMHNQFEFPYFGAGEEATVSDSPFGRLGSIICYDLCFPELLRAYALQGADVVLMSTAWPMRGHDRADDYHGWPTPSSTRCGWWSPITVRRPSIPRTSTTTAAARSWILSARWWPIWPTRRAWSYTALICIRRCWTPGPRDSSASTFFRTDVRSTIERLSTRAIGTPLRKPAARWAPRRQMQATATARGAS
jgi:predicted amidohydrolase